MTALTFAPMTEYDLDAVMAAELASYEFPWTRGNFIDSLRAGHSAWVCRQNGELLGYALFLLIPGEAELLNITVVPSCRRRGVASSLLAHICTVAREYGARRIFLEVRPSNLAGLGLYRRFQFVGIGRRCAYYPAAGGREDALVLARDLSANEPA